MPREEKSGDTENQDGVQKKRNTSEEQALVARSARKILRQPLMRNK
jgi:hypothetical protein